MNSFCKTFFAGTLSASQEFLDLLLQYSYPDNIQELQNIIACAVVAAEGDEITLDDLSPYIRERITPGKSNGGFTPLTLKDVVNDHIAKTVKYCGGDQDQAATLLGIPVESVNDHLRN